MDQIQYQTNNSDLLPIMVGNADLLQTQQYYKKQVTKGEVTYERGRVNEGS
jgi:hypothetical protein